jgi:hypothetical protein
MHYRHQVLNQFLLRRCLFTVDHKKFTLMYLAKVFNPLEGKSAEPVLVSHNETFDSPSGNVIHDLQETFALEIETSGYLLNKLHIRDPSGRTELLQVCPLVRQVGLLCRR